MSFLSVGVTAGIGLLQTGIGASRQGKANKKLKKLFAQRQSFQTPKEVFDILNSTQYNAQSGFDPQTMTFLNNSADRAFATNTGTALRLGADPNVVAGLDDQYLQSIMKIDSDNSLLQLQNFYKFLNAKQLVASNKEAEWASKEDILKDEMQMYGQKAKAGADNVNSGLNLIGQGVSNYFSSQLYADAMKTAGSKNNSSGVNLPAATGNNGGFGTP